MSDQVLAWHQPAWDKLLAAEQQSGLPQSLLLCGGPDTGKAQFAQALAAWKLCENPQEQGACGLCPSCRQRLAGAHPDLVLCRRQEDKKELLIDQIRQFCQSMQLTASQSRGRFGIILEADRLNIAAANALLKTLEEPPAGTCLILTAERLSRVMPTIRSRCQRISLAAPKIEQSQQWAAAHAPEQIEHLSAHHRAPFKLLKMAEQGGNALQAQQWEKLIVDLPRQADPFAAAAACDQDNWLDFIAWWQTWLWQKMRNGEFGSEYQTLWDALIRTRREESASFKRLLVLEGLFMLYLRISLAKKRARS